MTSREKVQSAFAHRQPDKVPMDIGGHGCAQMHVTNVANLRKYYGLEQKPIKVWDIFSMVGVVEDDLKEAIGADIDTITGYYGTWGYRDNGKWKEMRYKGLDILVPEEFVFTGNEEEGFYAYPKGDISAAPSGHMPANGYFFDNVERPQPIDEDNMNPEDNLEEFGLLSEEEIGYHRNKASQFKATNRAVLLETGGSALGDAAFVPGAALKNPRGLRTVPDWMMAPLLYPEYVQEVFDRQSDLAIENWKTLHEIYGDCIDAVYICGTDFGNQRSRMISREAYDECFHPYYKKMNDWIHENTNWKTLKHTCGAVYDVIPQLIASGFDAINPVQCSAAGMEPERLKAEFGSHILFWGAGVDTQRVLPFGTPKQVREMSLRRCEIFAKDGGFIFAAIHCIQCNTPVENIVAMIDALHEFNGDK